MEILKSLKQMYCEFMLERTKKSIIDNSKRLSFENQEYNSARLEQLRLMSRNSYLENKLTTI